MISRPTPLITKVRPCIVDLLPIHSTSLTKSPTLSQASGITEGARHSVDLWLVAFSEWDRLGLIVAASNGCAFGPCSVAWRTMQANDGRFDRVRVSVFSRLGWSSSP